MEQSNQDAGIKMVVGLGNPGPDYANTRHNAGAWLVERFVFEQRAVLVEDKRFLGQFAKVRVGSNDVFVLLPSTYMNRSGQAVNALARFYKLLPQHVLVVHDELDLLPGQVRLKQGGGSAGHNGVKDITAHLGTPNFWRLRIGIGHPRTLGLNQQVSDFVLHRPSAQHQGAIDEAIARGLKHLNGCFTGGFQNVITAMHTAVDVK